MVSPESHWNSYTVAQGSKNKSSQRWKVEAASHKGEGAGTVSLLLCSVVTAARESAQVLREECPRMCGYL